MNREGLEDFIDSLTNEYTVYGPVENRGPIDTDDEYVFEEVHSAGEVTLKHPPAMVPPKKYFFPEKENLMSFKDSEVEVPGFEDEFVVLGVHACDINSFLILDKMFAEDPFKDPYFERRRENSIVIGVECEPTENCFCKSMGAERAEEGFDLFLTEISDGDGYIVEAGSNTGKELVSNGVFSQVDEDFAEEVVEQSLDWEEEVSVETQDLPEAARETFYSKEIWEELGETCLACTNCTMVCPCCNCFDVKDEVSLQSSEVSRRRTWEACTLLEFAEVSGKRFRESIRSRYRNWFYDKYRMFPKEIDEFGCVGCGRCVKYCPVDIDPREVIQEVNQEYGG